MRATRKDWLLLVRPFENVGKPHAHESGKHRVDENFFPVMAGLDPAMTTSRSFA
jgi:hypothetical protein